MKRWKSSAMRSGILRRIEISPAFVALLCAWFYFDPAGTFLPFLCAATCHEAGHLLLLRLFHVRIHSLCLGLSGAVLRTEPLRYSRELLVAAAGPAVNFCLLLLCARSAPRFALVNFSLLCYNLLPFYPLDGGRVLRALLHLLLTDRAASIVERLICGICMAGLLALSCYLTCVWHAGLWPVLVCALLLLRISGTVLPEHDFFRFRC